jgi:hypothetical protein
MGSVPGGTGEGVREGMDGGTRHDRAISRHVEAAGEEVVEGEGHRRRSRIARQ